MADGKGLAAPQELQLAEEGAEPERPSWRRPRLGRTKAPTTAGEQRHENAFWLLRLPPPDGGWNIAPPRAQEESAWCA